MPSLRSSMLLLTSVTFGTFMVNAVACGSGDPEVNPPGGTDTSSSSSSSGMGGAGSSSSGSMGTCPQVESLLDVSKAPGAGASYPKPTLSGYCTDTTFVMDGNGIPTYTFVQTTPNPLVSKPQHNEIPRYPAEAAATTKLPMLGYLGFGVNGLPFFGPNEAGTPAATAWGDPIYNGLMDPCQGHTAETYHYHSFSEKCLIDSGLVDKPWMNVDPGATEPSPIVGWAADGFPILGSRECADKACSSVVVMKSGYEKTGDPKTNAWDAYTWKDHAGDATYLDECNGHHGPDGDYHYHATSSFPYILGCFRGTPMVMGMMGSSSSSSSGGGSSSSSSGMMGPKSCSSPADCAAADCPPGSAGCTCANSPMGMICVPTCSVAADCPPGPMGEVMKCNMGVCTP